MNQSDCDLIMQNQLFCGVELAEVEYMLEHCSLRELDSGEVLIQPDAHNGHLYLILDGELNVHLQAQKKIRYATLQAGECTGEISLVDGNLPSALVEAAQPTRVLSIPEDTVWSLVSGSHAVSRNLLKIVVGRLRQNNHALVLSQNERALFQQQAYVDALTGIHNRHWMNEVFPRVVRRCACNHSPVTVMVADMDNFKNVNDIYGHQAGDTTLRMAANFMTLYLRPRDLLVRYGGEEFVMLLPDTDMENAKQVAERLRSSIAVCDIPNGKQPFRVTMSIGIASTHVEMPTDTLIGNADRALYLAKKLGRNRVEIFS